MWTNSNNGPRPGLTYEDARMFWRARETYRARSRLQSVVVVLILLQGLVFLSEGHWGTALLVMGGQVLGLWGILWLLRCGERVGRNWWRGLVLGLLLGLSLSTSGCESYTREVARLAGFKGDPLPGPCATESVQVGYCVPMKQQGAR